MTGFLEGLAAGYGIAVPVGAVAVLVVNTAIGCGFRTGFVAGAGAATADLLYAIVASAAGAALTVVLQPFADGLRMLGGLVLLGVACLGAWRGLRSRGGKGAGAGACAPWRTYGKFLGITIINPLTVVYFAAFILGRSRSADIPFVLGVALSSLSWQTSLAFVGGVAGRRLSPRFQLMAVVLGNLLVAGLGVRMLVLAMLR